VYIGKKKENEETDIPEMYSSIISLSAYQLFFLFFHR